MSNDVLRYCGQFLSGLPLSDHGLDDVSIAIKQVDPALISLLYDLSIEVGIKPDEACIRVLPAIFQSACYQLLSSQEGKVNEKSICLLTLQNLHNLGLQKCGLSDHQKIQCYKLLTLVNAAQSDSISVVRWNLDKSIYSVKGISAYQYEAYFSIISANTKKHELLMSLGHAYGILSGIATDILNKHARFESLNSTSQTELKNWALTQARTIANVEILPLSVQLPSLIQYLR